ncbi:7-carboxy-7-deazaguanine synthase QueE [Candidatus Erwinia haradaeae]|uniref:7-carboxy-7-deazaguanine synthase n=1 Tax=Candidatus Erwinia haradaeae TaxID=1922217 RepID=A0A451D3G0_9GAMM|nr:7-carboxy-7-deazaguanine synthase QueE [Candidatus Erwinia haradaeae]VFP80222.1 7-carboxy-7-deazaguanine synthase [Candidatus Erwinia haradaeae]
MKYPINQIFQTLQGEGFYTGVPAIFIRFQGCPIGCSWCDTKYTWDKIANQEMLLQEIMNKKKENDHWALTNEKKILNVITNFGWKAQHIVITGGEPCLHDLRPLTIILQTAGFTCQIETSGAYPILCTAETWVTVSPKIKIHKTLNTIHQALIRADEIKYPVARKRDITTLITYLDTLCDQKKRVISLQPINHMTHAIKLCIATCISRNWRLSLQIHKYLNIS